MGWMMKQTGVRIVVAVLALVCVLPAFPVVAQNADALRTLTLNTAEPIENLIWQLLRLYKTGKYAEALTLLPQMRDNIDAKVVKPKYIQVDNLNRVRVLASQYVGRSIEIRLMLQSITTDYGVKYIYMHDSQFNWINVFYEETHSSQVADLVQGHYLVRGKLTVGDARVMAMTLDSITRD